MIKELASPHIIRKINNLLLNNCEFNEILDAYDKYFSTIDKKKLYPINNYSYYLKFVDLWNKWVCEKNTLNELKLIKENICMLIIERIKAISIITKNVNEMIILFYDRNNIFLGELSCEVTNKNFNLVYVEGKFSLMQNEKTSIKEPILNKRGDFQIINSTIKIEGDKLLIVDFDSFNDIFENKINIKNLEDYFDFLNKNNISYHNLEVISSNIYSIKKGSFIFSKNKNSDFDGDLEVFSPSKKVLIGDEKSFDNFFKVNNKRKDYYFNRLNSDKKMSSIFLKKGKYILSFCEDHSKYNTLYVEFINNKIKEDLGVILSLKKK